MAEQLDKAMDIILPPPDVRAIIDKTAEYVSKNGTSFEAKIRDSQSGNLKFAFLDSEDPYHGYYQEKIKRLNDGDTSDLAQAIARKNFIAAVLTRCGAA